jgi:TolB-like protein
MDINREALKDIVALAMKLRQEGQDNLSREDLTDICLELGVSESELQRALDYNVKIKNRKKVIFVASLAAVMMVCFLGWIKFSERTILTDQSPERLRQALADPAGIISDGDQPSVIVTPQNEYGDKKPFTLAVLPFKNQSGEDKWKGLATSCADAMLIPLSQLKHITLIERLQLSKVTDEIDLSQTEYIDPAHAIEIGKLIQADVLIVGALQMSGDRARISARIISAEHGHILHSEHVEGLKSDLFSLQDTLAEHLAKKF